MYLRQWLPLLQKKRPNLGFDEEMFNFDDLKYVSNADIDDEINKIVYQGSDDSQSKDYGLKNDLAELDVDDVYSAAMYSLKEESRGGQYDVWNAPSIGETIAAVAWDADKRRAEKRGLLEPPYTETGAGQRSRTRSNISYSTFDRESQDKGVKWLWDKIERNNEEFLNIYYDQHESQTRREDFETEEAFEEAEEAEINEWEREARSNSLPAALDDAIAEKLVELEKTDPLPYLAKRTAMRKKWMQKICDFKI